MSPWPARRLWRHTAMAVALSHTGRSSWPLQLGLSERPRPSGHRLGLAGAAETHHGRVCHRSASPRWRQRGGARPGLRSAAAAKAPRRALSRGAVAASEDVATRSGPAARLTPVCVCVCVCVPRLAAMSCAPAATGRARLSPRSAAVVASLPAAFARRFLLLRRCLRRAPNARGEPCRWRSARRRTRTRLYSPVHRRLQKVDGAAGLAVLQRPGAQPAQVHRHPHQDPLAPLRARSSRQLETTDIFFGVTKLLQHKDQQMRRLLYLMLKER